MSTLNPYLFFDGKCEEAFNFYKSVFGGEFAHIARMGEAPGSEDLREEDKNRIMHISFPIGEETLMGSDSNPAAGMFNLTEGNNNHISINAKSPEEAQRTYNLLSEGGAVLAPLAEQFWGEIFGNFKDKYGVYWMISCRISPK